MQPTELNLNPFVFLDGSEHEENLLKGRTIFMHTFTGTIIELFDKENDLFVLKDDVKTYQFEHINIFGEPENLILAVHQTHADDFQLTHVLERAASWYRDYCNWEDRNIHDDGL